MARHRYEFADGRTSKFWEIQIRDKAYVIRYGKLGSAGRTVERQFTSQQDAEEAAAALVRAKLKKGYREVSGGTPHSPRTVKTPRPGASRQAQTATSMPRPTGPRLLSKAIYREAEKKGADINRARDLPKSVKCCPYLVADFYRHIIWSKRQEFHAEIDDCELDAISFYGPIQAFDPTAYGVVGCEGMDLFGVGSHGGGNYILLLDGNDKKQSDPMVYEVDHDPEPGGELRSYGRLSRFLRSLRDSSE
jgi:predicted DNA-binding WGR domain protein